MFFVTKDPKLVFARIQLDNPSLHGGRLNTAGMRIDRKFWTFLKQSTMS